MEMLYFRRGLAGALYKGTNTFLSPVEILHLTHVGSHLPFSPAVASCWLRKAVPLLPPFLFQLMNSRLQQEIYKSGTAVLFTLKLEVNPFIWLFLTSYFFRKSHVFFLHTHNFETVLYTMTGCLQSLEMMVTQILLRFQEVTSKHGPVQLSSCCQNFILFQLLVCSDYWLTDGARFHCIFSFLCLNKQSFLCGV